MDLHFLNYNHNGDIHYSRMFMYDIFNIINPKKCFLHMNQNKNILKDTNYFEIVPPLSFQENTIINDDVHIVTWIGYYFIHKIIDTQYGASLTSNYNAFKYVYSMLGIESQLKNIEYYLPTVNYDFIEKSNIDSFFESNNKKTVLICNNLVLSGQSENFDFVPIINELATKNANVNFILSNDTNINLPNVFLSKNVIKVNGCDLLEISYLSTKCDIIVGRASGPGCFAHIKENYYNKNKIMVGISNNEWESNWHHLIKDGAKCVWINNYDNTSIVSSIQTLL